MTKQEGFSCIIDTIKSKGRVNNYKNFKYYVLKVNNYWLRYYFDEERLDVLRGKKNEGVWYSIYRNTSNFVINYWHQQLKYNL